MKILGRTLGIKVLGSPGTGGGSPKPPVYYLTDSLGNRLTDAGGNYLTAAPPA